MNRIKAIFFATGFFFSTVVLTHPFLDKQFDDFLIRFVAIEDHKTFWNYYEKIMNSLKYVDTATKNNTTMYLFRKAFHALKKEHRAWYDEIASYGSQAQVTGDKHKDGITAQYYTFLGRYGAYQEFLSKKVRGKKKEWGNPGIIAQVGSFFSGFGQTVAGWFGFGATKSA